MWTYRKNGRTYMAKTSNSLNKINWMKETGMTENHEYDKQGSMKMRKPYTTTYFLFTSTISSVVYLSSLRQQTIFFPA